MTNGQSSMTPRKDVSLHGLSGTSRVLFILTFDLPLISFSHIVKCVMVNTINHTEILFNPNFLSFSDTRL